MKRTSVVLGIGLLTVVLLSFRAKHKCDEHKHKRDKVAMAGNFGHLFNEGLQLELAVANLAVEDIHVIEVEEEIELGFDVADYLPEGFDPYQGMEGILQNNASTDEELLSTKEIQQLFAEGMRLEAEAAHLTAADIHVIEVEEAIDLGMENTGNSLQNVGSSEDLDSKLTCFLALELEEEIGFGSTIDDTLDFLSEFFSPIEEGADLTSEALYLSVDDIHVIEVEEEIEPAFDPRDYLPKNFDPYAK